MNKKKEMWNRNDWDVLEQVFWLQTRRILSRVVFVGGETSEGKQFCRGVGR